MTNEEYKKIVNKHMPKEKRMQKLFIAFVTGGFLGIFSEFLSDMAVLLFDVSKTGSYAYSCLVIILLSSLFTALGFFDKWVEFCKCGLIIPTTGFAHSVTSSSLEYKKDGMITGIGANVFKLAGSVVIYGIISSFILCFLRWLLWLV